MKLSVIIIIHNETLTIGEILSRVLEVDLPKIVIVVDDFPTDGTREFLNSEFLKRKRLPSFQLKFYNLLIHLFK
jgi:glycosyltransferase involved in cell wall biosynthesis